jgi:CheY-like chemotaxis protein
MRPSILATVNMTGAPVIHIVDDDASFRSAISRVLNTSGFEVVSLRVCRLLHVIENARPGCILLDVQMPALGGLQLQEELTKLSRGWPIIFMTGHGDIPTSVRAIKAGAEDFLTKPVSHETLLEAIQRAIQHTTGAQRYCPGATGGFSARNTLRYSTEKRPRRGHAERGRDVEPGHTICAAPCRSAVALPVGAISDASSSESLVLAQYAAHKSWSVQLHHDNLVALAETRADLRPLPCYDTMRRFMKANGLDKRRRVTSRQTAGADRAEARLFDLTVVLAGDGRLLERLRSNEFLPPASRMRVRLAIERATPDELQEYLKQALHKAGAAKLMTAELIATLCDHAQGNLRALMNMAGELLVYAAEREAQSDR